MEAGRSRRPAAATRSRRHVKGSDGGPVGMRKPRAGDESSPPTCGPPPRRAVARGRRATGEPLDVARARLPRQNTAARRDGLARLSAQPTRDCPGPDRAWSRSEPIAAGTARTARHRCTGLRAATMWTSRALCSRGGADVVQPEGSIGTPLDNAIGYGCWHVAELLAATGARIDKLWHAAALGRLDRIETLLAASPDQDQISQAFWHACAASQRRAAERLLDAGADLTWTPDYAEGPRSTLRVGGHPPAEHHRLAPRTRSDLRETCRLNQAVASPRGGGMAGSASQCCGPRRDASSSSAHTAELRAASASSAVTPRHSSQPAGRDPAATRNLRTTGN